VVRVNINHLRDIILTERERVVGEGKVGVSVGNLGYLMCQVGVRGGSLGCENRHVSLLL
jgi:hypothetical protein